MCIRDRDKRFHPEVQNAPAYRSGSVFYGYWWSPDKSLSLIHIYTPTNEMTLIFYRSMKGFDNGIGWKQYTYRVDGNEVELIAEDSWPCSP